MTDLPQDDRPLALVLGATGRQGGSVVRHLLDGGRFAVRALTRRPRTDEALTLATLGAEVVQGDADDVDSLRAAMCGTRAVFGMTDWWEHFGREEAHGRTIVDAAAAEGVAHLVLSTQPSTHDLLGACVGSDPFESKAQVERYARAVGVPATFVHVAFYWENLLSLVVPRPLGAGRFELALPMGTARLGGVAEDDIGAVVAAILAGGPRWIGRTVPVVGDARRAEEIAATLARVTGRDVCAATDPAQAPWARIPGAEALSIALDRTFAAYRAMDRDADAAVRAARALHPSAMDFDAWAESYRAELRWTLTRLDADFASRRD